MTVIGDIVVDDTIGASPTTSILSVVDCAAVKYYKTVTRMYKLYQLS